VSRLVAIVILSPALAGAQPVEPDGEVSEDVGDAGGDEGGDAAGDDAAGGDPRSPDDVRAEELYHLGDELYAQGRYEEAIAAFEEAFELSGRVLLLYNLANAQERAGLWAEAVESLERYRGHAPESEQGRLDTRIESLRRRIARLEQTLRPDPDPEPEPEPDPEPDPDPATRGSIVGPVFLGAAGGTLALGVTSAVVAMSARNDLDDACTQVEDRRLCEAGARDAADRDLRFSILADVSFVATAALAALGLYFLLREVGDADERDARAPEAEVSFTPARGGVDARVGLRARF